MKLMNRVPACRSVRHARQGRLAKGLKKPLPRAPHFDTFFSGCKVIEILFGKRAQCDAHNSGQSEQILL